MSAGRSVRDARRHAAWAGLSEVAVDGDARAWARRVARAAPSLAGGMSPPGKGFAGVLTGLPPEGRETVAVALIEAKNHYQHMADFFGAVGIPAFLAVFALYSFDDVGDWPLLVMVAVLLSYLFLYNGYRVLAAITGTASEALQTVVVELAQVPGGSPPAVDRP